MKKTGLRGNAGPFFLGWNIDGACGSGFRASLSNSQKQAEAGDALPAKQTPITHG